MLPTPYAGKHIKLSQSSCLVAGAVAKRCSIQQLDELESLLIQLLLMQDAEPKFVYKKTVQPFH
jgi:hypothetical protein